MTSMMRQRRRSGFAIVSYRLYRQRNADRILAQGPITVLKKPLKVEQLQRTVRYSATKTPLSWRLIALKRDQ